MKIQKLLWRQLEAKGWTTIVHTSVYESSALFGYSCWQVARSSRRDAAAFEQTGRIEKQNDAF